MARITRPRKAKPKKAAPLPQNPLQAMLPPYLTLIRTVTLLFQYQRPIQRETEGEKTLEYIESTLEDIKLAEELIKPVLGRSLDELPPQTRRLLLLIEEMVSRVCAEQKIERQEYHFSRRDVRTCTRWGDTQLKIHLHRLEELEYLIVHRGGRGQSFVYELIEMPEGDKQQPFLPGLIGIEKLKTSHYDTKKSGSSRPQVGGMSGAGRGEESSAMTRLRSNFYQNPEKNTSTSCGRAVCASGCRGRSDRRRADSPRGWT